MSGRALVVEASIGSVLGPLPPDVVLVPRRQKRSWRPHNVSWRQLEIEQVLGAVVDLPIGALVVAREAFVDPGAACLAPVARLAGHHVLRLPDDRYAAAWCVGVLVALRAWQHEALVRAMEAVCCGPQSDVGLPRTAWAGGLSVPALRPATLARWADCAWRSCSWCPGGALPGHRCRRCGAFVDVAGESV